MKFDIYDIPLNISEGIKSECLYAKKKKKKTFIAIAVRTNNI